MTKKEFKQTAQDKIMQRLADALLIAEEEGVSAPMVAEMRKQTQRVGRLFGYTSWAGIGQIKE